MSMQRSVTEAQQHELALQFKALGDPARVAIMAALARKDGEICVCDFVTALGLNQSTVSHHLKILKEAELVRSERRGTWGYYSLAPSARKQLESALASLMPIKELV